MRIFGLYSLYFAHAIALWGVVVSLMAVRKNDDRALKSVERSLAALLILTSLSVATLVTVLLKDDFTIRYVYEYSRRAQPFIYKLTALWGGMNGSLLFWEWLIALYTFLAIHLGRDKIKKLIPFSSFVFFLVQGFFLFILTFKTNPFSLLLDSSGIPVTAGLARMIDGNGLNPLLQNFYMTIHPPLLYLGFVGFTVPFAFVLAVLWNRETSPVWQPVVRYWSLYSWLTLGMGIIFGSYWAYIELGWGGYWAWDPVENASLIPWLTATAFLHSFFMEKKRGLFKTWNVFLVSATFVLSIYGTYLTRSGVLQSVHSFGQEGAGVPWYFQLGNIFLSFMAMMIVITVILIIQRRGLLKPEARIESASSRESMALYANLLFTLFATFVFYGVTSPIFYRIFTGRELYNGVEFYNPKAIPVTLMILLVMAMATIAPWRKGGGKAMKNALLIPSATGMISAAAGVFYLHSTRNYWQILTSLKKELFYFIVFFFLAGFIIAVIAGDYVEAAVSLNKKKGSALFSPFLPILENPRRYGGYIVHLGIISFCVGAAFSTIFQKTYQESVKIGEAFRADKYTISLSRLDHDDFRTDISKVNEIKIWADLDIFTNDRYLGTLTPMRIHYKSTLETEQPPAYEVAVRTSLFEDIYLVLSGFDTNENFAVVGVYLNPFMAFLWLGGLIILVGGIVAFIPPRRKR